MPPPPAGVIEVTEEPQEDRQEEEEEGPGRRSSTWNIITVAQDWFPSYIQVTVTVCNVRFEYVTSASRAQLNHLSLLLSCNCSYVQKLNTGQKEAQEGIRLDSDLVSSFQTGFTFAKMPSNPNLKSEKNLQVK